MTISLEIGLFLTGHLGTKEETRGMAEVATNVESAEVGQQDESILGSMGNALHGVWSYFRSKIA